MKRKIDWLQFGQFLAMVMELWITIKTVFKERKIGPEILEWTNGPGKQAFREFLVTLAEEYRRFVERERQKLKLVPLTAEVDLDIDPTLPFDGAKLKKHLKQGKVQVEYRSDKDELYINGKKVVPWLSTEQLAGGRVKGTVLVSETGRHNPLNATLADFLFDNQSFIPKGWQDRVWYFWGSEWSGSDRDRYVRYLCWRGARGGRDYDWLELDWSGNEPSASLAS